MSTVAFSDWMASACWLMLSISPCCVGLLQRDLRVLLFDRTCAKQAAGRRQHGQKQG